MRRREDRKANQVAFQAEKVAATHLFHKLDPTKKQGSRRKGNSSRCPHQVKRPVPIPKDLSKGSISLWSSLAFVSGEEGFGQETARTGNRAEAGRKSGRSGWDPGPSHTQPYQSSREQHGVSKNIYSESKLMRHCISADNGRMWGWALQGRRPMHNQLLEPGEGQPCSQRRKSRPAPWGQRRRCRHTTLRRRPRAHPPLEQEHILDPHGCKEHCQPASLPHSSVEISSIAPSLKATQGCLEYLC